MSGYPTDWVNRPVVYTFAHNGSSITTWMDGVQKTSTSAKATPSRLAVLGMHSAGGVRWSDWELGEVLLYNAVLSSADRIAVITYLQERWTL